MSCPKYAISLFDQDGLFDMVKPMNLYLLCSPNAGTNRFEQQDYVFRKENQ